MRVLSENQFILEEGSALIVEGEHSDIVSVLFMYHKAITIDLCDSLDLV